MGKEMLLDPTAEWRANARKAEIQDAEEQRKEKVDLRKMSLFSRRGEDNLALEQD